MDTDVWAMAKLTSVRLVKSKNQNAEYRPISGEKQNK